MRNSVCCFQEAKTNMASDDDEIPETGAIFTFGKTRFAENLANKFWIRDDKVLKLACGDEHSAVVTCSGRLYTFGNNDWGQLGHGNTKPYTKPSLVKKLKGDKVKVVSCGRSHTLVISESGVFSFGAGADSQLGHGDNKSYNVPTEIEALNDKTITQVACGAEHSAALSDNGELYVWGSGSEGQLGLGIAECELPSLLKFRSTVTFVACGYYHTAVITELGKLYTFGDDEAGKLGLEDNQCDDTEQPQQVKTLNEPAVYVACGGNHTAVLTKRGSLFTFGSGMHGQLGHGPAFQDVSLPRLVSALQGKFVSGVSCGESHTAVLTKHGEMFTFGDGRHGKLGMGDESFSNLFKPTKVARFKGFNVEQVYCGGCHMLVLAARNLGNIEDSEGSEDNIKDDCGEDVPDGGETTPRLSQTVPMLRMSARDKRRQKDNESIGLASSLPPLNRSSLPPLASLGSSNIKKEDIKPRTNSKLNPLDRSTLPIISVKSPSPDDEENGAEKQQLSNSRQLPPRPKRRQKRPKTASDSEEENYKKERESTIPRPTPPPRKQKPVKDSERNNEDNIKKSRKQQKGRDAVEKSGSEASDEDSEEDDGNHSTGNLNSSRNLAESEERKKAEMGNGNVEDVSEEDGEEEGSEEEGSEEEGNEEERKKDKGKESARSGKENSENKDNEGKDIEEDEGNEDDEEESEDGGTDDGDEGGDNDKGTTTKTKSVDRNENKEETEVINVEAVDSGKEEDEDENKKKKDNSKDSKEGKKDKKEKKKKGKTKEDDDEQKDGEEKENENDKKNKEKAKGKKGKKDKNKCKEEQANGGEDEENNKEDEENNKEDSEIKDKKEKEKDESTNEEGKKTKKSGVCVLL